VVIQLLLQHFQQVIKKRMGAHALHWIFGEAIYEDDKVLLPVGKLTMSQFVTLLKMPVMTDPNITQSRIDDDLPIHVACRQSQTPLEVIQCLVEAEPKTVLARNGNGSRPFAMAAASNTSLDVIFYLYKQQL
jgi:hypothetical protein